MIFAYFFKSMCPLSVQFYKLHSCRLSVLSCPYLEKSNKLIISNSNISIYSIKLVIVGRKWNFQFQGLCWRIRFLILSKFTKSLFYNLQKIDCCCNFPQTYTHTHHWSKINGRKDGNQEARWGEKWLNYSKKNVTISWKGIQTF